MALVKHIEIESESEGDQLNLRWLRNWRIFVTSERRSVKEQYEGAALGRHARAAVRPSYLGGCDRAQGTMYTGWFMEDILICALSTANMT